MSEGGRATGARNAAHVRVAIIALAHWPISHTGTGPACTSRPTTDTRPRRVGLGRRAVSSRFPRDSFSGSPLLPSWTPLASFWRPVGTFLEISWYLFGLCGTLLDSFAYPVALIDSLSATSALPPNPTRGTNPSQLISPIDCCRKRSAAHERRPRGPQLTTLQRNRCSVRLGAACLQCASVFGGLRCRHDVGRLQQCLRSRQPRPVSKSSQQKISLRRRFRGKESGDCYSTRRPSCERSPFDSRWKNPRPTSSALLLAARGARENAIVAQGVGKLESVQCPGGWRRGDRRLAAKRGASGSWQLGDGCVDTRRCGDARCSSTR